MILSSSISSASLTSIVVEATGLVVVGRAGELVVEAERIEEAAQHSVVVVAEALVISAERIGHRSQRHVQVGLRAPARSGTLSGILRMPSMSSEKHRSLVATLFSVRTLEGVADHGGARHFAESPYMRQA